MKLQRLKPLVAMLPTGIATGAASLHVLEPKRIRGRRLQAMRQETLTRDRFRCQRCLRAGRQREATQVDHIVPLYAGGTDAPENREGICDECHVEKNAEDRATYGPA